MVRRIRILVLLLVSGVSVAASGADNSASANDESHSSLPDLASESAEKEEQENKGKSFKEQGADYFINSATQGFDNLTPEALESQARSYLQNQITSSAQSYLEGVMSPYGKIRTSLSVGEGGDLDGSSLDYFIPWYDNQSTLFFSQISAQRKEDRTIGNFGLGVRQNVGNWLLGGNAFYDYDFTRGHRRLGLGTEAWTDYLKFSGNYYHPLSDWKDSEDFDFYEERPARGWDIRMESWLPFYPQLGAKLVYEQYYGDEVALFGTDNLQKDPHAVTLGLEYTPVPLVTVGTDYKAGTGDSNDFSVNATVNYQIGTPLAAQLDPENVKIQHSLMGSRTDFVDRNNFIILEYREKDPLDVTLWLKADATNEHPECVIEDTPEAAVGLEKCKWTVNALINHHYKIISASWQAKNNAARTLVMPVVKANALTEGNNNSWNLVLPAWVNADTEEQRTALNTWKVRMTLEDEKGNKQNSGVVEITVQQDRKIELIVDNIADTDRSDHSHEASALADGEDGVVMDLLITDSFGDSTDRNGNELVDDAMTPVLYDSNDKKVTLARLLTILSKWRFTTVQHRRSTCLKTAVSNCKPVIPMSPGCGKTLMATVSTIRAKRKLPNSTTTSGSSPASASSWERLAATPTFRTAIWLSRLPMPKPKTCSSRALATTVFRVMVCPSSTNASKFTGTPFPAGNGVFRTLWLARR